MHVYFVRRVETRLCACLVLYHLLWVSAMWYIFHCQLTLPLSRWYHRFLAFLPLGEPNDRKQNRPPNFPKSMPVECVPTHGSISLGTGVRWPRGFIFCLRQCDH